MAGLGFGGWRRGLEGVGFGEWGGGHGVGSSVNRRMEWAVLTLTENATLVIKSITGVEGAPEGAGVRISQDNPADPALAVTTTEAPQPGDQVVEEAGARVFLEHNAASALDDKILDAAVDDKGGVEFLLVPQPGAPTP
ncbi:Fe-S cluster assembly iron-binding protein IscA [Kribbella kalugense]|uniref:Fe-S cluster assembly iron-binding protein IscA n=1 Tax=Kribbella kalugense TaxID=2512221 RepID=A0A4R8A4C8_9ACTN|nr:Fe-S cluster assembly iron-binding protein IscA [Kribbella kalugense]